MGEMDKYSNFLDKEQSYSSPFTSTNVAKTTDDVSKQNKSLRSAIGKLSNSELEEEALLEDHLINKLKKHGWKEKEGVDKETASEYTVLNHKDHSKNNHEYYIDNDGKHFYHFYHKDGKTQIDAGLSHTLDDHIDHMGFGNKKSKSVKEEVSLDESALKAVGQAVAGGLAKIGNHIANHASKAVNLDQKATSGIGDSIKKGLGTVGHVDLLTHSLGSTGTFSIQAGFVRRKDENGRETGPHKFNLRVRHDNWRTGQRTVRDIVGREYENKKNKPNSDRTFKPRFRYGRGLSQDTGKPAPEPPKENQTQSEKPKAYNAFDKGSDTTSGETKAKSKIKLKKFSAMKAPKDPKE